MSTELALLMVVPSASRFAKPIEDACIEFGIKTVLQKAHFMAQCAHESGGFRHLKELGGPKYLSKYDTGRLAEKLGNTPQADGDGAKYCGRGLIQLTGKSNYRRASLALFGDERLLVTPSMLEEPVLAARSAGYYWQREKLNRHADADDVWAVSRGVNLGNPFSKATPWGMDDRIHWTREFKRAFDDLTVALRQ